VEAGTEKDEDRPSASTSGLRPSQAVECEVRIEASPETIFEFFTDPAKAVQWMGDSATLDPRPGGIYRVEMNEQYIAIGEYVEVDPPHRVVFTWGWQGDAEGMPPGSSTVEITLEPDGDATVVRVVHSGIPTREAAESHRAGWNRNLPKLAVIAAGGVIDNNEEEA
jgi:uncharacterized protein YndB with AHSA1/START domain